MKETKTCTKCKIEKELKLFNKQKSTKDGLSSWCRDCFKEYNKKRYKANLKYEKTRSKQHRLTNPEYYKEYFKQYYKANLEKIKEYDKLWHREYRKTPKGKLDNNMRCLLYNIFKFNQKESLTLQKKVGYSVQELKNHFSKLFTDGMSWDNYGEWEIDHIRPVSSFNYTKESDPEFQECFSLKNLQPLWREENMAKGMKY